MTSTPNSLPSTSERCHTAANKLRDFDTRDLEASTHLLVWLGEILNEAEATLRLASFELARSEGGGDPTEPKADHDRTAAICELDGCCMLRDKTGPQREKS